MFEECSRFAVYKSLGSTIEQYKEDNFVKLSNKNCTTIQYANRNIKKNKYDDKHIYSYVRYVC